MAPFPALTLTYFHAAGRAEAPRLALYIGGVPFVDKRLTAEQFGAIKSSLPLGQAPTLEVDGQVMTQSQAILRFAGRLGGLYPVSSPFAALKVDEIVHVLDELAEQMGPAFREQDADKKKVMREELASVTIPSYATKIEARLEAMQKMPIFQSDAIFIHHVAIYAWVKSLRAGYIDHIPTSVVSPFKLINAIHDRLAGHPKVQEWYSLPHTPTPKLKLTYFPYAGRAGPIRLALFMAGIPFEDNRVSHQEFQSLKSSLPFEHVPVLEIDGEVVSQSLAIVRYVGSLSGLYPTVDPIRAIREDEIFALVDELYDSPIFNASLREAVPGATAATSVIPKSLEFLEKRVAAHGGPYATGSTLGTADLALYVLLSNLTSGRIKGIPTTILEPFVNLKRVLELVGAHPKIAEWNAANQ